VELLAAALGWALFGLIVGGLARLLFPGQQPMGCLGTILLGVAGSFAGGFVAYLIRGGEPLQPSGFFASLICGVLILLIASRNRTT
jgi:uncharacterized membrane protein YeaQ/YmgE (transglycosylase-associated protein family)